MPTPHEEGYPTAKICVVAEAPGRTEVRLGRPLVGPAGQVFADCLHTAKLARASLYILNTWPFMVDKDKRTGDIYKDGRLLWHNKKGMTDLGLELAQPTIDKIKASRCNIVLTMGQQAMELLCGEKRPIMKWRGSIQWSDAAGKKFVPAIHPAATIHGTYVWRYLIIGDMEKAKAESESPELDLPNRNLAIAPSYKDVMRWMEACITAGQVATDLEVINHHISCFSLAYDRHAALTVPMYTDTGANYWTEQEEADIWLRYSQLMGDPKIKKINQNLVGFDAPFLADRMSIFTRGDLCDPMIAQSIVYPDFKKGLDFLASVHTREPYWKDDGKIWKNPKIPWDVFQRYCGRDACVALEAWEVLEQEMLENGYMPTYSRTIKLAYAAWYMMLRGLAVNRQELEKTKTEIEALIIQQESELNEIAGRELNVGSPKQCREYFYDHLGLPEYRNQNGGVTTDDKAMARIVRKASKGSREAKLVQEIRAHRKLKSSYLDVDLDSDGRLRCSWNLRGTWTGRLSSSQTLRGTGMNLQNLHPQFKGFIIAG